MASIIEFISENIVVIISILVIARFIGAFLNQNKDKEKTKPETVETDRDRSLKQKAQPRKAQAGPRKSSPRNIDAVYPVRVKNKKVDRPPRRNQRTQQLKSQRLTPSNGRRRSSKDSLQTSSPSSFERSETNLQRKPLEIEEISETKSTLLGELNRKERQQRIREAIIMKEFLDPPAAIKKINKKR